MLTDRQRRMLRFLSDPTVCPEGLTIQRADQDAIREVLAEIERVSVEYTRQRIAFAQNDYEIEQILGRALGYPKFVGDQKNFPGATDADGVCVGEHVAVTLADEAARRIEDLQNKLQEVCRRVVEAHHLESAESSAMELRAIAEEILNGKVEREPEEDF